MTRNVPAVAAALGAITVSCASLPGPTPQAVARPNVIVILADDLGYGDVSAYGGSLQTPNIDALAADGVRYTDAYVTAAVCAPSRAGLLSGRHQSRFGFEFNPVGRDETSGLPKDETTIAQVAKSAGYATGMVGKWHIGQSAGYHPLDRGFDSFYGLMGGATSFWQAQGPADMARDTGADGVTTRARLPITDGRTVVDPPGYLTDVFTDKAIDFVRAHRNEPFFLYLAYTAPHTPLQATDNYLRRFPDIKDPYRRIYAAMVASLDDGVGRLRAELKAQGLDRNTVVVFLSDNGCPNYIRGACSNGQLAGYKAFPWEGGVRVPFIVSAPGRLPAGAVSNRPISSLDLMPTTARLAGAKTPAKAEGRDLLTETDPTRPLFWRMGPNHAVRIGPWKLLVVNKSETVQDLTNILGAPVPDGIKAEVSPLGQHVLLFNLATDPGEKHNQAAAHPEIVARLERAFQQWDKGNAEPMFTSRRQFHAEVDGRRVQLFN